MKRVIVTFDYYTVLLNHNRFAPFPLNSFKKTQLFQIFLPFFLTTFPIKKKFRSPRTRKKTFFSLFHFNLFFFSQKRIIIQQNLQKKKKSLLSSSFYSFPVNPPKSKTKNWLIQRNDRIKPFKASVSISFNPFIS